MNFTKPRIAILIVLCAFVSFDAHAVTSKVVRHAGTADFAKGKTQNVIINSEGTLELGPSSSLLADKFPDAWTINTIVADQKGALYIGTSPNGAIFKYADGELRKIYPADANTASESEESEKASDEQYLTNEHIFALAFDGGERLLAGISGDKARLLRFDANGFQSIFEPNDAKYIFAIAVDELGNIYLGTGPKGKVYRLNPFGLKPETIYESTDKNFLSLAAGSDGSIYAGGDERGLIYRIDPAKKTAAVLYDAEQSDIIALAVDSSGIFTRPPPRISCQNLRLPPAENLPGKPEIKADEPKKVPGP